ncbi:hypothetical protein A2U01_0119439, partial [Trifolium medium]|nr:hypothetical protein [Trifolium medium]
MRQKPKPPQQGKRAREAAPQWQQGAAGQILPKIIP